MFSPKKKLYLTVKQNDQILYDGSWNELPLSEKIILEKSVEFFDDPEPCFIHRDAVRFRLLSELEDLLPDPDTPSPDFLELLTAYTDFPNAAEYLFSKK